MADPTQSTLQQRQIAVLAFGEVGTQINKLIKTCNRVISQGQPKYVAVFVTGNLFPNDDSADALADSILNGSINFPIPTYFIAGNIKFPRVFMDRIQEKFNSLTNLVEIVPNLIFCPGAGYHICDKTGLRFAYISGTYDPVRYNAESTTGNEYHWYTQKQIDQLQLISDEHIPMDLLITFEAPPKMSIDPVTNNTVCPELTTVQSPILEKVVQLLQPRYHIVGGPQKYYERVPYHHADSNQVIDTTTSSNTSTTLHYTRFLSLGSIPMDKNSSNSGKWAYAFALTPFIFKTTPDELPSNCTSSPFTLVESNISSFENTLPNNGPMKRPLQDISLSNQLSDNENTGKRIRTSSPDKRNSHDFVPQDPLKTCWFCLPCEKADRELVFTVGSYIYGAVTKGALVPGHILYVVRQHVQHWHRITDNVPAVKKLHFAAMSELATFQRLTTDLFTLQGKLTVSWQIGDTRHSGQMHAHMQMLPIDATEEEIKAMSSCMAVLRNKHKNNNPNNDEDTIKESENDELSTCTWESINQESSVMNKIVTIFTRRAKEHKLKVYEVKLPNEYVGSLTEALYEIRRQELKKGQHIIPSYRHMVIMVGNRLLYVGIRGRVPVSIPREAIAEAIGMRPEVSDWRDTLNPVMERAQTLKMAHVYQQVNIKSQTTGITELDERLAHIPTLPDDVTIPSNMVLAPCHVTHFDRMLVQPGGWMTDDESTVAIVEKEEIESK